MTPAAAVLNDARFIKRSVGRIIASSYYLRKPQIEAKKSHSLRFDAPKN